MRTGIVRVSASLMASILIRICISSASHWEAPHPLLAWLVCLFVFTKFTPDFASCPCRSDGPKQEATSRGISYRDSIFLEFYRHYKMIYFKRSFHPSKRTFSVLPSPASRRASLSSLRVKAAVAPTPRRLSSCWES